MHIFDVVEIWGRSMEATLNACGAIARFDRSSIDRPNPFCSFNVRRNDREADLTIWDSGEAELVVGTIGGSVSHTHFDDVRNRVDLSMALSTLSEVAFLNRSS
jgi:hypothetical protein